MPQTLTVDNLLSMGRSTNATQFIGVASSVLAQGVQHDGLRLLLMQRLVEHGLLTRAEAVAEKLSPEVRAHPEFVGLRRALTAQTGGGLVPWRKFAERFEANLAALRQRYEWADQVAAAWQAEQQHLELHVTKDGVWQVFDLRDGPTGGWRPAYGSQVPQPSAEELAAGFKNQVLTPFVIEGVGLGYHLPWLHAATADTFLGASALIYQVEPSLPAVAIALHINDWTNLLMDPRVRVCAGPDAYEQFERLVAGDAWNVPPPVVIQAIPWMRETVGTAQRCITKLAAAHEARQRESRAAADAVYRGRDRAWWHRRFTNALRGTEPPLRVLGFACRFTTVLQYSLRDALRALEANGCQTRVLVEPSNYARIPPGQKLRALREFEPDLIFLIDHTRDGQRASLIPEVPVATWVQDRLPWLFSRDVAKTLGPLDFCLGYARNELVERYGYPAERFMPCLMATDPAALCDAGRNPAMSADEQDAEFACDVAYATNAFPPPAELHREYREQLAEPLRPLLDATYEELRALAVREELNGGLVGQYVLDRLAAQLGMDLAPEDATELATTFVRPLADRLLRLQTIEWAADWAARTGRRFHLYGNGWDAHPEFRRYARGFVVHGPALGRAFRAAKINLHAGCNTAFHQRVLDGLAAGGFFLIRRHAEDIAGRTTLALGNLLCERRLKPGDTLAWTDLPPALGELWVTIRQMQGVTEPRAPLRLTEGQMERMKRRYETMANAAAGGTDPSGYTADTFWPEFDRVTFATRAELAERLDWFTGNADERGAIAATMRERLLEVFSQQALMKRLLSWIADALRPG